MWWQTLLAECGSSEHCLWQPSDGHSGSFHGLGFEDIVAEIDGCIAVATATSRASRMGMIGSTSYTFPGKTFREQGPAGVRRLTLDAATALASAKNFGCLVIGNTIAGPQGDFVLAFHEAKIAVVHVLPSCASASRDLRLVLYDQDGNLREKEEHWHVVICGENWTERNRILASLAAQYCVIAGGPGTLMEVSEARQQSAGLLPIPGTGGLVEGLTYQGKGLGKLEENLRDKVPPGVSPLTWQCMLNPKAHSVDFEAYRGVVQEVFSSVVESHAAIPTNIWPLSRADAMAHSVHSHSTEASEALS